MAEIDYVVTPIKITQRAVIDFQELCKVIKKWLSQNKYLIFEKEYTDDAGESGKDLYVKFVGEKKVDDYTKFKIEVKIKTKNLTEVYVKRKKMVKGTVTVSLESYFLKDYENLWEGMPIAKFLRGCYDRFLLASKFARYAEELTDETYHLHSEIKGFLNILRI